MAVSSYRAPLYIIMIITESNAMLTPTTTRRSRSPTIIRACNAAHRITAKHITICRIRRCMEEI